MAALRSKLHKCDNYWRVNYHEFGQGEGPHIHFEQGGRKLVVLINSDELIITHKDKKFTKKEIEEILQLSDLFAKEIKKSRIIVKPYGASGAFIGSPFRDKLNIIIRMIESYYERKRKLLEAKENLIEKIKMKRK